MASYLSFKALAIFVFGFALAVQGTLGLVECELLDKETCAFAVSFKGKRCVLEKHIKRTREEAYTCKTSDIDAYKQKNHVETDQCIKACGLDRMSLGISSDFLLETHFTNKLCSHQCYGNCPNVVDLYFNLAAGEGVFLPKLCEAKGANVRRGMAELRSSGIVAPGPLNSMKFLASSPESDHFLKFIAETNAPAPNK